MIFKTLTGDDLGVYHSDSYRLVQCLDGHIVFSYTKQGQAITIHLSFDKKALRDVKIALNKFCEWLFLNYQWCQMILGVISKPSVQRMVKKCQFLHIANSEEKQIYMRLR